MTSSFFVAGEAACNRPSLALEKLLATIARTLPWPLSVRASIPQYRINDVALVSGRDFAAEKFPNAGEMLFRGHARDDGVAAGREFVEDGNVESP